MPDAFFLPFVPLGSAVRQEEVYAEQGGLVGNYGRCSVVDLNV